VKLIDHIEKGDIDFDCEPCEKKKKFYDLQEMFLNESEVKSMSLDEIIEIQNEFKIKCKKTNINGGPYFKNRSF
jgi:hypothetical protein